MTSPISNILRPFVRGQKLNILTYPSKKDIDLKLSDLGHNIYYICHDNLQWHKDVEKPNNCLMLTHNQNDIILPPNLDFDILFIPDLIAVISREMYKIGRQFHLPSLVLMNNVIPNHLLDNPVLYQIFSEKHDVYAYNNKEIMNYYQSYPHRDFGQHIISDLTEELIELSSKIIYTGQKHAG